MEYEYQFPEQNPFRAKEVTEPDFFIQSRLDWFERLRIDFSPVRSTKQFDSLKFVLGMAENRVEHFPNEYAKVIFSGHRGCGKSVEMKRFADDIDHHEAFFPVFIDLEQETNIEQIEPEDIFVTLISVLIRKLTERKVKFDKSAFSDIAAEWLSESEVKKSISNDYGLKVEKEASAGWSFWEFFSIKGRLSGFYARSNNTTKTIRQKIKANPKPLLIKLNAALVAVRTQLRKSGRAKDMIFLLDGLEKANPAVYESLFVKDVQLITGIEAHLISTVPISTFYEIQHLPIRDYFRDFYLPMVRVGEDSRPLFRELITRRVDENILAPGVLDFFIEKSGGCPRILLKLVNRSIVNALGHQVTQSIADEVATMEGNERLRTLTARHKEILHARSFNDADKETRELLQSLNVLEYNGLKPERRINPLIERFFQPADAS